MRCLAYLDISKATGTDTDYNELVREELPQRLALMPGETLPEERSEKTQPEVFTPDETWETVAIQDMFTLQIQPQSGRGLIGEKGQKLGSLQVRILRTLADARIQQGDVPALVPEEEIYRRCIDATNFNAGLVSSEVNRLRGILKFHSGAWADRLVGKLGKGFALLHEGENLPEEARPVAERRVPRAETPWSEETLTGGVRLNVDPETGKGKIDGVDYVWSSGETDLLRLMAQRYPETIFGPEIERVAKVTNAALFVKNFLRKWEVQAGGITCPFGKSPNGRGLVWTVSLREKIAEAGSAMQPDSAPETPQAMFDFADAASGMRHSRTLDMQFTLREVELLTLLASRTGEVLDLMAATKGSKFNWNQQTVLVSLENAQKKIAAANPQLAARIQYSKRNGTMHMAAPPRTLPRAVPA